MATGIAFAIYAMHNRDMNKIANLIDSIVAALSGQKSIAQARLDSQERLAASEGDWTPSWVK